MWSFTTIREQAARSGTGASRAFSVVSQQPSWITKAAVLVGLLIFSGIVLLLVVPALLVAAVVFFVLLWMFRAWLWVRSLFGGGRSGRRNVRVIVRE